MVLLITFPPLNASQEKGHQEEDVGEVLGEPGDGDDHQGGEDGGDGDDHQGGEDGRDDNNGGKDGDRKDGEDDNDEDGEDDGEGNCGEDIEPAYSSLSAKLLR